MVVVIYCKKGLGELTAQFFMRDRACCLLGSDFVISWSHHDQRPRKKSLCVGINTHVEHSSLTRFEKAA